MTEPQIERSQIDKGLSLYYYNNMMAIKVSACKIKENTMGKLDPNNNVPLYKQLQKIIIEKIEQGVYPPKSKIPSEETLCETYGVSRVTVRNALNDLVEDETLQRIHGKGTYVAEFFSPQKVVSGGSFTESAESLNLHPTTKVLERTVETAGNKIAERLQIPAGRDIIRIQRLRLIDDLACILETGYFTMKHAYLLDLDLEDVSLLAVIKRHINYSVLKFVEFFDVYPTPETAAAYLDCALSEPLLRVSQTVLDESNKIICFNEQLIRSDRYKYAVRSYSD